MVYSKHIRKRICLVTILAAGFFCNIHALGPSKSASRKSPRGKSPPLTTQFEQSKDKLIEAIKNYKKSLEELRGPYEKDLKRAKEMVEIAKELYSRGAISKQEVTRSIDALLDANLKLEKLHSQIAETDNLIAEVYALDEFVKFHQMPLGAYYVGAAVVRYNGAASWSPSLVAKVKDFFKKRFGRPLPISAYGQTGVHEHLRFDHRYAMDVAVHPDSSEGRALLTYLREAGIPFIGFRYGIPGSATNAHLHIGKPSRRVTSSSNYRDTLRPTLH